MNFQDLMAWYDFKGRVIVIPGGAGILGGEMACALVGCGADVVILDYKPERAGRIKDRLECGPGTAQMVFGDVLDRQTLLSAGEKVLAQYGRVDAVINAAGGNSHRASTNPEKTFFDLPEEALKQVIDLNLVGTIFTSQVFGKIMAEQGEGVILNISSMSAYRSLTRVPAYSAAKAAISNFTQWLAVYMAQEFSPNIRVNAIAPGFFHTTQNHYLLYEESGSQLTSRGQAIIDHTPMGRFGEPQDLLGAMFWLLSPASKFVTGTVIPIDGGFSAFSGV